MPQNNASLETVVGCLRAPDRPAALLALLQGTDRARRAGTASRLAIWSTVALSSTPMPLSEANLSFLKRELLDARRSVHNGPAIRRLTRLVPERWDLWAIQALQARATADPRRAERCLRRAAALAPGSAWPQADLASMYYGARRYDPAIPLLERCALLSPMDYRQHHDLAMARAAQIQIDVTPPRRFLNSLKRWLILDPDLSERGDTGVRHLRLSGDWRGMVRLRRWVSVVSARAGSPAQGAFAAEDFERFEEEVRSLAPLDVRRDFPSFQPRPGVLLHPKLPDDGPWVLHGPADQVDRAMRILAFVNPDARLLRADRSPDATGKTLSLVPSEDPDAWYFPCLYGHWHTYWTALPAILGEDGQVDVDRVLAYCIRTRQFLTFWYAKGHERQYLAQNAALGRSIAERMADAVSRERYLETLAADRRTYIKGFFERLCRRVQYYDYAVYRPGDVILNLGVAEGFEIPAYLSLISPGGTVHNIDPDGYRVLGKPARAWIDGSDCRVDLHELALSDVDGEIEMETGACWEDTRVSKRRLGQLRTIPSKRLDTFVREQSLERIDHVKLDIEGGEGFLLDQLIALMRSHRPQIEISIYHTVEQFIEIPDRMMRETEGYRFYFDHYCGHFGEGTLYAIPEEIEPTMPL